jgi:YgiT-type zinc finger domain-containing protein
MTFYPDALVEPASPDAAGAGMTCTRCGEAGLVADTISSAFWRGGGLVVIDAIPALVCGGCREEYISDDTAVALDNMRGTGFNFERASRHMEVPVFRFVGAGSD